MIKKIYFLSLFFICSNLLQAVPPQVLQNWLSKPFDMQYSFHFESSFTLNYTNQRKNELNEQTQKVDKTVLSSNYTTNLHKPLLEWKGDLFYENNGDNPYFGKYRMELERNHYGKIDGSDDKQSQFTYYFNSDEFLVINHSNKIARRIEGKNAWFFVFEWPTWVPAHHLIQNYKPAPFMLYPRSSENQRRIEWKITEKREDGSTVLRLDIEEEIFYIQLIFDSKGILVEKDQSNSRYREQIYNMKYITQNNRLILTDFIGERYVKDSLIPNEPMETFEFHVQPETIQTSNVTTFDLMPQPPENYRFMDSIK